MQGIQNVLKLLGDMAETGSLVTDIDDLAASKTANEARCSLCPSHRHMVAGIMHNRYFLVWHGCGKNVSFSDLLLEDH